MRARIRVKASDMIMMAVMGASLAVTLSGARWSYESGSALHDFFLYQFSHANVWHWLANMLVLWQFRPRTSTWAAAYAISVLAAMADAWLWGEATCGMSALACAAVARKYAAWRHEKGWKGKTVLAVMTLAMMITMPRVNWHVHLVAFGMGYAMWCGVYEWRKRGRGLNQR